MVLVVLINTSSHFLKLVNSIELRIQSEKKKKKRKNPRILLKKHTHKYNPSIRFL